MNSMSVSESLRRLKHWPKCQNQGIVVQIDEKWLILFKTVEKIKIWIKSTNFRSILINLSTLSANFDILSENSPILIKNRPILIKIVVASTQYCRLIGI